MRTFFGYTEDMKISPRLIGRVLLILFFSFLTFKLLSTPVPRIFIDEANLLIHETGHLLFLPFGQFIHMTGGTLLQLIIPSAFLLYFFLKKDYFASFATLFWVGDNLINISVYMRDAQDMILPLLIEGSIHDWNWIFSELGILSASNLIGSTIFYLGAICAFVSLVGMSCFTFIDYEESRRTGDKNLN